MRQVIEGIRGVAGVWGVILWDKSTDSFERLLPARMDDAASQRLCELLSEFSRQNRRIKNATIKVSEGWLLLYDNAAFTLLLLARNDLNRATLRLVLRSALASLQSSLGHGSLDAKLLSRFSPKHITILVRTINLCLSFFQGKLPKFEIAGLLRQVKDELVVEYPVLKNLTVDANGGIIPIRGAAKSMDATLAPAAAQLVGSFLNLVSMRASIAGFDVEKLTEGISGELSELGFYSYFKQQEIVSQ